MAKQKAFERIFIIILENQLQSAALDNGFMKSLASEGVRLSNYFGITHPSQPNYIAAIAGLPFVTDDNPINLPDTSIVDLLEAKNVTWKAYMEDLPENNKAVTSKGLYFRKHNPFISFDRVRNDPQRLAKIVNAKQLAADVKKNDLPQFSWFTPNIQNDGHTPPANFEPNIPLRRVDFLAQWLKSFLQPLRKKPNFAKGTLVVVIFDESVPHDENNVYAVLLGEMVKPNTVESTRYDHYSLLRTVEENFGLGTLNRNDLAADWFRFLWGEEPPAFNWAMHSQ